MWGWICLDVGMDLLRCGDGFAQMWGWICLDVGMDLLRCGDGFAQMWHVTQFDHIPQTC